MRKIEVSRLKIGCVDAVSGESHHVLTDRECSHVFGELPYSGETRTYYIVPAGDVAEFDLTTENGDGEMILAGNCDYQEFPISKCKAFFGIEMKSGETRRVTAIVHPADEPGITDKSGDAFDEGWDDKTPDIPKQPIILKRNNTPTREGNYAFAGKVPMVGSVEYDNDGDLRVSIRGYRNPVTDYEFWSDELGPIEFEAEPETPPNPKVGWFEHEGSIHRVMQLLKASEPRVVVDPPFREATYAFVSDIESKGIEITWYGDK